MDQSWLTLLLLALVAGFVPMLFGFETFVLGEEHGLRRGISFFSGIALFRIVFFLALMVIFPGLLTQLSSYFNNRPAGTESLLQRFGRDATSGQHAVFDVLLILAGLYLCFLAYRHFRRRTGENTQPEAAAASNAKGKDKGKGAMGLLVLGFTWMAVSVNQWIFMGAGVAQIISLTQNPTSRVALSVIFLFIASLMLILPIFFYIVRPQSAEKNLAKITNRIHHAKPYIVVGLFAIVGLYFLVAGAIGLSGYLGSQQVLEQGSYFLLSN